MSNWESTFSKIAPTIFRINTHNGSGTGFILSLNGRSGQQIYGLATAYHVVASSHELEIPIRITHQQTKKSIVLKPDINNRVIIPYPDKDLAFIIFGQAALGENITPPRLVTAGTTKKAGVEVAWCGFPSIAPAELCFSHGFISSPFYTPAQPSQQLLGYLVDGVVINGVSGGPVFFIERNQPKVCGVITQYLPNLATGQALPGLGFAASVEPYQQMLTSLQTLDDAQRQVETQQETNPIPVPPPAQGEPPQT